MSEFRIYVNSNIDRRPTDTTDNFETYFTEGIPINGRVRVSVSEIEFPNVAPNFPFYQSRLYYVLDPDGSNEELKFIEIDFNKIYRTISDLVNELNNKFQANGDDIVVSSNSDFNNISITNNTSSSIRIVSSTIFRDLTNEGVANTINERLGFTQDLTNSILAPSASITGAVSVRMLRSHCYFLTLQDINDQPVIPFNNFPDGENRSILCRITASNFGTLSQLYFPQSFTYEINQTNIRRMRFQVLDDEYQQVDLQEHPITFSLELKAI